MKRKSYRPACDHALLNYKVLMRKMEEFLGMLLVSCCRICAFISCYVDVF